jgi:non-ribosomal peptide synthetase component F
MRGIEKTIGQFDVLEIEERRLLLEEWNSTAREVEDQTLEELFEEQVEKTPESIAVVSGEEKLSYAELNARSNREPTCGCGGGPDARKICLLRNEC